MPAGGGIRIGTPFTSNAVKVIMIRFIQSCPSRESNGLAIGFGIPRDCDTKIRKALPNWGIVLTEDCPSASLSSIQAMRRAASRDADTPLLLLGLGEGTQTVFRMCLSNLTRNVIGLALFDGEYPTDEHSLSVLHRLVVGHAPRALIRISAAPPDVIAEVLDRAPALPPGPEGEGTPERIGRMLAIYFGPDAAPLPSED